MGEEAGCCAIEGDRAQRQGLRTGMEGSRAISAGCSLGDLCKIPSPDWVVSTFLHPQEV